MTKLAHVILVGVVLSCVADGAPAHSHEFTEAGSMPGRLADLENSGEHFPARGLPHRSVKSAEESNFGGDFAWLLVPDEDRELPPASSVGTAVTNGFCTGTLIANQAIITAAHCVHNPSGDLINGGTFRPAFDVDLFEPSPFGEFTWSGPSVHPSYDETLSLNEQQQYDVAVAILDEAVTTITDMEVFGFQEVSTGDGFDSCGAYHYSRGVNSLGEGKMHFSQGPLEVTTFGDDAAASSDLTTTSAASGAAILCVQDGEFKIRAINVGGTGAAAPITATTLDWIESVLDAAGLSMSTASVTIPTFDDDAAEPCVTSEDDECFQVCEDYIIHGYGLDAFEGYTPGQTSTFDECKDVCATNSACDTVVFREYLEQCYLSSVGDNDADSESNSLWTSGIFVC